MHISFKFKEKKNRETNLGWSVKLLANVLDTLRLSSVQRYFISNTIVLKTNFAIAIGTNGQPHRNCQFE